MCDACVCAACPKRSACEIYTAMCISCHVRGVNPLLACVEDLRDNFVLAVVGTREDGDWLRAVVRRRLELLSGKHPGMRLVTGGCVGVDLYALEWAIENGCPVKVFLPATLAAHPWPVVTRRLELLPSEWVVEQPGYGPADLRQSAPYLARNRRIAAACTHMLAFPGPRSRGTWHAVAEARKLGKPVAVYRVDPEVGRVERISSGPCGTRKEGLRYAER